MNVAYLSAFSALAGSAIGGVTSIATTWLTQHSQDRSRRHAQSVGRRERLYGDFIDEASMLYIDALPHDQFDPSKFVQIYATIAKLRLFASAYVISKAEKIMRGSHGLLPTESEFYQAKSSARSRSEHTSSVQ
jgi:hypothetical protein